MFQAIVLDLDGTYLSSDKRVSERNLQSVMACYNKGIAIIIATARPPRTVKNFLPEPLLKIASFVYYNGAQISCPLSGLEMNESIPGPLTSEIVDYCLQFHAEAEMTMEVQDEWYSLKELDYSAAMSVLTNPVVKSLEDFKRFDATKILLTGFQQLEPFIHQFGTQVNILITDDNGLVQIMSKKASKEEAVKRLCDNLHIDGQSVLVFGDDYNDIGLFRTFGYSVAMGNAIKELKEIASDTTGTNDQDGVAQVLERLVLL
ncbi:HAD family hydrolase [Paenibacillus nasutitermitis]|uniref:5-amino-6-(5-phospho-D-ribitylamino)uracil phosphatase YitU n=1 Tax=Paenibacillus nasutitermitis TaxID=1652958 RepID=A0A917DMV6_9BACL|nr:HAD family hydrolase [Paenibacillus nasutitermitis]GGD53926.1 5-amino-6-(5-phospho-D-ribitylamino)uracil phosphatase YitU [Paenibacillus nasutitermitis]